MIQLPEILFWYLWIIIALSFIGIYKVFATKPKTFSVRFQQFQGVVGLLIGFVLLAIMLGWIQ